jgi:hypothetical protein
MTQEEGTAIPIESILTGERLANHLFRQRQAELCPIHRTTNYDQDVHLLTPDQYHQLCDFCKLRVNYTLTRGVEEAASSVIKALYPYSQERANELLVSARAMVDAQRQEIFSLRKEIKRITEEGSHV